MNYTRIVWKNEELTSLLHYGFELNSKGDLIKNNITLVKRHDQEFDSLDYQLFVDHNMVIMSPNDWFNYLDQVQKYLISVQTDFSILENMMKKYHLSYSLKDDGTFKILESSNTLVDSIENSDELERILLYLLLNKITQ